jgi:hypothetical protein
VEVVVDDVRWQQRLGSYLRAFRKLDEAVVLVRERQLSDRNLGCERESFR